MNAYQTIMNPVCTAPTVQRVASVLELSPIALPAPIVALKAHAIEPVSAIDRILRAMVEDCQAFCRIRRGQWAYTNDEKKFGDTIIHIDPVRDGIATRDDVFAFIAQNPRVRSGMIAERFSLVSERSRDLLAAHLTNGVKSGRLIREGKPGRFLYSMRET